MLKKFYWGFVGKSGFKWDFKYPGTKEFLVLRPLWYTIPILATGTLIPETLAWLFYFILENLQEEKYN
jgi:hypothetical protein